MWGIGGSWNGQPAWVSLSSSDLRLNCRVLNTKKFEETTVEFRFSQLAEKYVPEGWSGSGILGNQIIRILQPIFRVSRSGSSGSTVLAPNTFVIRNDTSLNEAGFNGNTF